MTPLALSLLVTLAGAPSFPNPTIILKRHTHTDTTAHYLKIDLAHITVPGRVLALPALPDPLREGQFIAPSVILRDGTLAAATPHKDGVALTFHLGPTRAPVPLSGIPAALHVSPIDGRLFAGVGHDVVQLAPDGTAATVLHHRDHMSAHKAYDLFVEDHGLLMAIDDKVRPFYADSFALSPAGPKHVAAWALPGLINGHYALAALSGSEAGRTLYVVTPFRVTREHGHTISALKVVDNKIVTPPEHILNQG